jgi:hypothetical protein
MKKLILALALLPTLVQADNKELCAMLATHAAQIVVYEQYCGVQGYMLERTAERMAVIGCPKLSTDAKNNAFKREKVKIDALLVDAPDLCYSPLAKDVIGY